MKNAGTETGTDCEMEVDNKNTTTKKATETEGQRGKKRRYGKS